MAHRIGRSPSYLIRNPYSYCFRIRVPMDLQKSLNKKELRYSLRTGYLSEAKSHSVYFACIFKELFRKLRKELRLGRYTNDELRAYVNKFLRGFSDMLEGFRVKYDANGVAGAEGFTNSILGFVDKPQEKLAAGDYSKVSLMIDRLIEKFDLDVNPETYEYKYLCREMLKAKIKWDNLETNRAFGYYSDDLDSIFPIDVDDTTGTAKTSPKIIVKTIPEKPTIDLEHLIEQFSAENIKAGNWSNRTQTEYASIFKSIKRLLGNPMVETIDINTAQNFKKILMAIPDNYFIATKQFDGIQPTHFLDNPAEKTLSPKTVNKYLTNLSALLNHAKRNGYIKENFADGLKIRIKKKQARQERDAFSDSDLNLMIKSDTYTRNKYKNEWEYWLPILGLYTGARLEELCQLTVDDIKQEHEIWLLDIREDAAGSKRVKTESSNRKVPLHPTIINAGFIEYVNQLKKEHHKRLWPDLKKIQNRWGHYPSRRFGDWKRKLGITSPKKTFHSFRHNFQDNLKQQLVPSPIIDELVGHVLAGETMGRYGKEYKVEVLYKEGILKLNYDIDLTHLKKSKYVNG